MPVENKQYTFPAYEAGVEADVKYASVMGYWSRTDSVDRLPLWKMLFWTWRKRPVDLMMDIYTPEEDSSGSRPLLLMLHGGSFLFGNKGETGQVQWCRHFASLGYVAVSMDYRLGFRLKKGGLGSAEKEAVEDAAGALAYLLGREDLRIDPDRVFVAGTSAGGAVAMGLAYDPPRNMPPCRIRAVGDLWGYIHDLSLLANTRVPVIAYQSEQDPVVPYDQGYPMGLKCLSEYTYGTYSTCRKAEELGIPSEHHPCPEKGHRLHLDKQGRLTPRFFEIRQGMTAFFAERMEDR